MQLITAPITTNSPSDVVTNLQDGLFLLLNKGLLGVTDAALPRFQKELQQEQIDQLFGTTTSSLISIFQRQNDLAVTGEVDEATADRLNQELKRLGAFDDTSPSRLSQFVVQGRVFSHELRGLPGLTLLVVDKNIGQDTQLSKGISDNQGHYKMAYSIESLKKAQPDIQVQVFYEGKTIAVSPVRYNASPDEGKLDILVPAGQLPRDSEYVRLLNVLGQHLGNPDRPQLQKQLSVLKEDDRLQDITYLANKSGWDARMVAMTSLASQFSQRNGIDPAFYYALFRSGIPANEDVLSQLQPKTVQQVWEQALELEILPNQLKDQIPEAIKQFSAHSTQQLLEAPAQIGVSSFKDRIATVLKEPSDQKHLADLYYTHRDNLEQFWKQVETDPSLRSSAARLKLDSQLNLLTINNVPLVQQLHERNRGLKDPLDLVRGGFYQQQQWVALLQGGVQIPKEILGDTEDQKQTNYAAMMSSQLRLRYPTAVVSEMVKRNEMPLKVAPPIQQAVTNFLNAHQGRFELGIHPIEQYLQKHREVVQEPILGQLKKLQRVFQISPSDEIMAKLLDRNLDSAYAIVRYDEQSFIQTFQAELGGEAMAKLTQILHQDIRAKQRGVE